jgi:hypothetical protein
LKKKANAPAVMPIRSNYDDLMMMDASASRSVSPRSEAERRADAEVGQLVDLGEFGHGTPVNYGILYSLQ